MSESSCICCRRQQPFSGPPNYPQWEEGEDNASKLGKHGYLVVKGVLSAAEVDQTKKEISRVVSDWFSTVEQTENAGSDLQEIVNILPEIKEGKIDAPSDPELSVRKLYRLAVHYDYFASLCKHPKLARIATEQLGPNVKLLQSMALLKPPGGGEKAWHQDNAYFRLTPCRVLGCWIALDPTDCSNGCMHVLPSSHQDGVYKHDSPMNSYLDYSMVEEPTPEDVVPVFLSPGDALVFHGHLAHYTPPNVSNKRRRSIQFHYAASECKTTKCPKESEQARDRVESPLQEQSTEATQKPRYFNCDPSCKEAFHWHLTKAELLVCGKEFDNHI